VFYRLFLLGRKKRGKGGDLFLTSLSKKKKGRRNHRSRLLTQSAACVDLEGQREEGGEGEPSSTGAGGRKGKEKAVPPKSFVTGRVLEHL